MVCLIRQQEAGRGHRREELNDLRTSARGNSFNVRGNVVEDDQKSRIYSVQVAFAGSKQSVDRLLPSVFNVIVIIWGKRQTMIKKSP
jgi:hypothetical protein